MKHYTLDELKAAWPHVAEALRPKPKRDRKPIKATNTVATSYVEAALTGEWQAVKNARPPGPNGRGGERNSALNRAAFNLGTLVGAGLLTEDEATGTLLNAVDSADKPLPEKEARSVIQRGLNAGRKHPRDVT